MERKKPKLRGPNYKRKIAAPPWTELPRDVTANILYRLGAIEIIENAQKVCTTWRRVCLDPAMWRVIDMKNGGDLYLMPYNLNIMCRHVVDRSQGQLIDINIQYFGDDELLQYIAERSNHLKRLTLASCYGISGIDEDDDESGGLSKAVKNFPKLEELHLINIQNLGPADIEAIGISCPKLKLFTFNKIWMNYLSREGPEANETALAVAKNMPNLRHLQLIANEMTNEGLEAIFNGCPHLEWLDLPRCNNLDLGGPKNLQIEMFRICLNNIFMVDPTDIMGMMLLQEMEREEAKSSKRKRKGKVAKTSTRFSLVDKWKKFEEYQAKTAEQMEKFDRYDDFKTLMRDTSGMNGLQLKFHLISVKRIKQQFDLCNSN